MKLFALIAIAASLLRAQTAPRPRILGVAHIALRVSDVDQSRAFYKDFLGFAEPFKLNNTDGSLALTFIKINDAQYIELFPGLRSDEDRLHHISIQTDNAERMRVYLASRGIKVPDSVPKGRIGNLNFNVQDPDGHTVEIVEYAPDGWSMREKGNYAPAARVSRHMLHLGIIVGNLDAAMRFYRDILGFTEIWRGSSDGKTLSWVNMKVPDGGDYIEFMLYRDLPAADKRGVVHHIALEVPDMTEALAVLEARPYRKMYTRPLEARVGKNRRRQLNLFDPDGTRTELMEPNTVDGKPTPWSEAPALVATGH
ncbi:MAG: bleomycin resistance protein [Acidobacteria bacterium]|nr:MAG: bleomycin resistance protein [Acidobacteriota bacterium]